MPWEICFSRANDGIRQERYISVNSKCCYICAVQQTPHQKPPLLFVGLLRGTVPLPIDTLDAEESALLVLPLKLTHLRTNQEDAFYKINHILLGRTVQHCMQIHAVRALCSSRYEATSGNSD